MTQGIEMGFVSLVHPGVGMFEGLWREGLGISEPSWGQRRAVSTFIPIASLSFFTVFFSAGPQFALSSSCGCYQKWLLGERRRKATPHGPAIPFYCLTQPRVLGSILSLRSPCTIQGGQSLCTPWLARLGEITGLGGTGGSALYGDFLKDTTSVFRQYGA